MTPTNEEIIKGNRVIAEAMELTPTVFNGENYIIDNPMNQIVYNLDMLFYHSNWSWLMPAIEYIRDQMGLHTVWQTMKVLQENYAKVGPEDFDTITDVWKAVVIYFESKK